MIPKNYPDCGLEMSNFDGSIDEGMAEALMAQPNQVRGSHSAWDYHGAVYFKDGKFHEDVYRYQSLVSTETADTLPELFQLVRETYGTE